MQDKSTESYLTPFGRKLSEATRSKIDGFDCSTKSWPDDYNQNYNTILRLKQSLLEKPEVLIVGAGNEPGMRLIAEKSQGWLKTGVHWTNFHQDIQVDIITSTHTCTLEACHYFKRKPLLLIHGVYDKVPPVLKNSITIRWGDPFVNAALKGEQEPTAHSLEESIKKRSVGVAPYIPSVRNTLFLNAMIMIWLGAKKIAFVGVNPHDPQYFFSDNDSILLEIVRCLSRCDPWLAEWDGRNFRVLQNKRKTAHRIQKFINNILTKRSAVGDQKYIDEFNRGFTLLSSFAKSQGVELGYMGSSSYMESIGLNKIG